MHPQPLLADRSPQLRFIIAGVVPAVFGAITGIALGYSEPVYIVLSVLGILGGIAAGYDHDGAREGAIRGVLGGLLFGAFILLAHEISGREAKAHLPEPAIVLVVITTILGALFGAIGGALRARHEHKPHPPAAG
jgi:MFS family permease